MDWELVKEFQNGRKRYKAWGDGFVASIYDWADGRVRWSIDHEDQELARGNAKDIEQAKRLVLALVSTGLF